MRNLRDTPPKLYKAFLLRICLESEPGTDDLQPDWRSSPQDGHSVARRGFTSLDALPGYLVKMLSGSPDND
jgi:hypothetical protein